MGKYDTNYWILTCNSKRYNIHELFKNEGSCLWNQRRPFALGDIVYIYETKPVSKIVYKTIVDKINIERAKYEDGDSFYSRDFSKEYDFRIKHIATNDTNRLQYNEIFEQYGMSGMKLMKIPQINDSKFIEYIEDVFSGKVGNIPTPPTKEELYELLPSGSLIDQIRYKMDFCELKDSHVSKISGISGSTINRIKNGYSTKSEIILSLSKALNLAFTEPGNETQIIKPDELPDIIKDKIRNSGIRSVEYAKLCNASPSVISHFMNSGILPKYEILSKLIEHFNFKIVKSEMLS